MFQKKIKILIVNYYLKVGRFFPSLLCDMVTSQGFQNYLGSFRLLD